MNQLASPIKPRVLPIMPTVNRAYELAWQNRHAIIQVAWLPLILLAIEVSLRVKLLNNAQTGDEIKAAIENVSIVGVAAWGTSLLLGFLALISFSVSWRRHLLLHEAPNPLFCARPLWRYLGFQIAVSFGAMMFTIMVMAIGAVLVSVSGGGKSQEDPVAIGVLLLAIVGALCVIIWWVVRHILLFTAAALDVSLEWKMVSLAMQGNVMRFIAIFIMTVVPFGLLASVTAQFSQETVLSAIIIGILQALATIVQTVLGASAAALVYDYLVHGGGPNLDRGQTAIMA